MFLRGLFAVTASMLSWVMIVPPALAQDPDPDAPAGAEAARAEDDSPKLPWALYIEAGTGVVTADDINPSIETAVDRTAISLLTLADASFHTAVIGWQLPKGKGDFRLVWNGFKEEEYEFVSTGRLAALDPSLPAATVVDNLIWWTVNIRDGERTSVLSEPQWRIADDDANMDGTANIDEVYYDDPELESGRVVTDNLQNRVQTIDLLYGRVFGKRRYTARWWGGLRWFDYEGNIPATAWLKPTGPGEGFTDGEFIRLIPFQQDSSGGGGTGSLEAQFNFFESRLQFFAGGQFAFVLADLETDSGDFFTLVNSDVPPVLNNTINARLVQSRNKSTWQNTAEAGLRINLKNGLKIELAYNVTGYLDTILMPTSIRIPQTEGEANQGTSAIWNTQDIVFDGWRSTVAFQF